MIPHWAFIAMCALTILNNVIVILLFGVVRRLREEVLTTLQDSAAGHEGSVSEEFDGDDQGPG